VRSRAWEDGIEKARGGGGDRRDGHGDGQRDGRRREKEP